ncbi:MAG: purine-nucleoside phosphorylase [Actinomycetota bacterium]|nr:purine-nucleoside phosphorylase [Actinomycetota bacterium]
MTEPGPIHLRPAAELAERVLLPGDPHRALAVAQAILDAPKMFNHTRGLWGYTGTAPDGGLLTVQATGMGGPSAAIVVEELIVLGARTLVRIGTCGALGRGSDLGELVVAREVVAADGASASLGAEGRLAADPGLTDALVGAGAREVVAVSTDVFYDRREGVHDEWMHLGADVVEMEAATLLALARRRGVAAAVLLAVTDLLQGARRRLDDEAVHTAGIRLGETAYGAMVATGR